MANSVTCIIGSSWQWSVEDEAAQEEKRAVELDPFARAWSLGNFYLGERQFDSAINELQAQSRFRPDDSGVHENLSTAYWLKGMYKESEQESEKLLRLEGGPTPLSPSAKPGSEEEKKPSSDGQSKTSRPKPASGTFHPTSSLKPFLAQATEMEPCSISAKPSGNTIPTSSTSKVTPCSTLFTPTRAIRP